MPMAQREMTQDWKEWVAHNVQRGASIDEMLQILIREGIEQKYAEPSQGQYYEITQEFKPHTDYFEHYELEKHSTPTLGQRTWTFMIYLNDVEEGGHTSFVNVGLSIPPKRGMAVLWNNLKADGMPNYDTLHHGTPVKRGYK